MTPVFDAHGAGAVPDARGLRTQLGFVEHLFHIAQAVRPLRVLRAENGALPAAGAAAFDSTALVEKVPASSLAIEVSLSGLAIAAVG